MNILQGLVNSAIIAVLQTAGMLLICSMAGYGLARIPFRWATPIFYSILVTLMIPPAVTFVPSFIIVSQLRWVDTYQGIIVPVLFSGFTTFLFRQYFLNFPRSLEEAARVDGLGYFGAYWRVVVPNSGAFFAAIAVITFIASWNAFLWPLVIGQDSSKWTVQVALSTFLTAQTINLHELFLAAGGVHPAPGAGVRVPPALPRAGGCGDRHQGLIPCGGSRAITSSRGRQRTDPRCAGRLAAGVFLDRRRHPMSRHLVAWSHTHSWHLPTQWMPSMPDPSDSCCASLSRIGR